MNATLTACVRRRVAENTAMKIDILFFFSFPMLMVIASPSDRGEPLSNQVVVKCPMEDGLDQKLAGLGVGAVDKWGIDEERKLHFRISSENWAQLQAIQSGCSLLINNVKEFLDEVAMKQTKVTKRSVDQGDIDDQIQVYSFDKYLKYKDIMTFYTDEIVNIYSNLAKIEEIGETFEKRKMYAVRITADPNPKGIRKIYLQCLIHAREWITGPVCMSIAKYLCEEYSKPDADDTKDTEVTDLLDNLEFVIVPVVNPDGYEYSRNIDRLWRKNRSESKKGSCYGTDLNRNFNHHWGEVSPCGKNTCDNEYHGDSELSEIESQTIVGLFSKLGNVLAAVDFHSFGQIILRPYVYANIKPSDNWHLKWFSIDMSNKIRNVNGETYKTMRGADLYQVSGSFTDWAYDNDEIKKTNGPRVASFAFELRGKKGMKDGGYGFMAPADEIRITCDEIIPAVVYLAKKVKASPLPTPRYDMITDFS